MKRIHIALTFDVEQWDPGSREASLSALLAALGARPATWFVAEDRTQSFCERYPEIGRRVLDHGHELAAHVHFQRADAAEMAEDVRRATAKLRALGSPCVSFRGGAHVFSDRLAEEICALGYRFDSSAMPGLVRRYHTRDGDTFAAYPHVWSARPYWWRPGLLELPTASFPLTRPLAFAKKRFRIPLLLETPRLFRARTDELAAAYPAEDVPLVVIGHSFDLETPRGPEKLAAALAELGEDRALRWCTLETLGEDIAGGAISAGLKTTPPAWVSKAVSKAAHTFTERVTHLAERARRFLPK